MGQVEITPLPQANLRYKDKDRELIINNFIPDQLGDILDVIKYYSGQVPEDTHTDNKIVPITQKQTQTQSSDRPVIRERIPNQIDLAELDIKKAITEEPQLRCPDCGQTDLILVVLEDKCYLMRKEDSKYEILNTYDNLDKARGIIKPARPETAKASIKDFHDDIYGYRIPKKYKGLNLAVNAESNILCPVCGQIHPLKTWIDAFNDPIKYGFEYENICNICGGEMIDTINENKETVLKCESCGQIKKGNESWQTKQE